MKAKERLRVRFTLIFLLTLAELTVFSFATGTSPISAVIEGKVVDDDGLPISTASAKIVDEDDDAPTSPVPQPVDLAGRFSISVQVNPAREFSCQIEAPGFETLVRHLAFDQGHAQLGVMRLKRKLGLQVSHIALNATADDKLFLVDIELENKAKEVINITSEKLQGTAQVWTGCADASPTVDFAVNDQLNQVTVSEDATRLHDVLSLLHGSVTFLPCKQIRLDLSMDSLLTIRSGEVTKVRFEFPQYLKDKTGKSRHISLPEWRYLGLTFVLENGTTLSANLK